MKVILDFDDFSPRNTSFNLLEEIKGHYPNFKVTLFMVPYEIRFSTPTPITEYAQLQDGTHERRWKAFIEACQLDWVEIALHGLTHNPQNNATNTPAEFEDISYEEARKRLLVGEKMMLNTGIPYAKLFKAPFWLLSPAAKKAAEDLGWKVSEDGYYNWNLKDDMPHDSTVTSPFNGKEFLIGHGHIQITMGNGLEESLHRIYQLPTDSEFHFLSEYYDAEKIDPAKVDFRDPLEQYKIVSRDTGKELK